ncbi:MAG: hypothetical protein KC877_04480 [Candidatus Kaiserbacteria bacterium]|nr:hypothetical protein [Candidatus Kaiserbacteria bacterium]MCB9816575.1 hypothetical protein [Candidatus Nomurabacteria bacterium]
MKISFVLIALPIAFIIGITFAYLTNTQEPASQRPAQKQAPEEITEGERGPQSTNNEVPLEKTMQLKQENTQSPEPIVKPEIPAETTAKINSTTETVRATTVQNSINELVATERQIGPDITVGYIWRSFEGSPKFKSLRIPIWDFSAMENEYQVDVWNGNSFVFYKNAKPLADEIIFPEGGVSQFRVTGIDPEYGICPGERSRFTWMVTFATDGTFNGERVPITIDGSADGLSCKVVR